MNTIAITLYNRPKYTKQLFQALKKCWGIENYKIHIFIDPGCPEVIELAEQLILDKEITINEKRLDCNGNICNALDTCFQNNNYVILFEDDTIPSEDCLKYFEFGNTFEKDDQVFDVSAFHKDKEPKKAEYGTRKRTWFTPWGWATWADRWKDIRFFINPDFYISWDCQIGNILKKTNLLEIYPTLSRTQNVGAENGRYCPDPAWHKLHVFTEFWAGTCKLDPTIEFYDSKIVDKLIDNIWVEEKIYENNHNCSPS